METILSLEHIHYRYNESIEALKDISLEIREGERFAIIGANGTGKTTLLQIMNGLLTPSSGKILFKGREVSKQTLKDRGFLRFFRERVGYVFQDSEVQLFCPTVLDELLYGPLQLDLDRDEAMERAFEIMKMLNIEHLKERPPYMLSGGEKKKVAIGSVLTMNPEVLLLDEPTNGLDPKTQCFLVELMLALNEAGKTLVIATHDLSLVDELQTTVSVLSEEHRIEKTGSVMEILGDEELLLRVNLIHEHAHRHGEITHRHIHSHYLFHRHEGRSSGR
ncbi:MAG: energy-coupling factor ABC transporter ATP-binding protein [Desulfobacterota bacterium]|nr:energy-coupling factor ABC transporter ATP-binding protein [Thermodesulfobacteriota bacterium]